jgi:dipeptidyl aminopeptidase/acylaminoacyl peptidase
MAAGLLLGVMLVEGSVHILASMRPGPNPALAATIGADWRNVEMTAGDGAVLRAWLVHAAKPNGAAAMVLHGIGDSRRGMVYRAKMLAQAGYTVLIPDSRGHGESGGELVTFGILEKDDVHRWADWLAQHEHPQALFGLGSSMGGAILIQALENDTRFRAAVAECPFADFHDAAYDRTGEHMGLTRWMARLLLFPAVEPGLVYSRMKYGLDLRQVQPFAAIARTKVPVLLIHGDADERIPPAHSVALHAANPGGSELWLVPGAGHVTIAKVAGDEFPRRVLAWFQR